MNLGLELLGGLVVLFLELHLLVGNVAVRHAQEGEVGHGQGGLVFPEQRAVSLVPDSEVLSDQFHPAAGLVRAHGNGLHHPAAVLHHALEVVIPALVLILLRQTLVALPVQTPVCFQDVVSVALQPHSTVRMVEVHDLVLDFVSP